MKSIPIILFFLGLVIEVMAFFVGNADHIPWLLGILSPSYHNARRGLNTLNLEKSLEPHNKGFNEISHIFIQLALQQNPPETIARLSVNKFERKGAYLGFSRDRAKEVIPVEVHLSNGQIVELDINSIIPHVEKLKTSHLFKYAVTVFMIGVIIQIVGFILERYMKQVST